MTRRCSHCNNNGHNTQTRPVKLTDGSIMKKRTSMGNLSLSSSSLYYSCSQASPCDYLSDDPAHESCLTNRRCDRRKGVPWTEEEHRMFLVGLSKMGKGDWRGIARNFIISKTPTQVASHAQKYFIRQTSSNRIKKRRSSLFDMAPLMANDATSMPEEHLLLPHHHLSKGDSSNMAPSSNLSLDRMDSPSYKTMQESDKIVNPSPVLPQFFPVYLPISVPFWLQNVIVPIEEENANKSCHQVVKPVPVWPKEPLNVDEVVRMSQQRLGLSLKKTWSSAKTVSVSGKYPCKSIGDY